MYFVEKHWRILGPVNPLELQMMAAQLTPVTGG